MTAQVLVVAPDLRQARDVLRDVDPDCWRYVSLPQHLQGLESDAQFVVIDPAAIPNGRHRLIEDLRRSGAEEITLIHPALVVNPAGCDVEEVA